MCRPASTRRYLYADPECSNLPGTATQCSWNAPGPQTATARVRVVATDAEGGVGSDFPSSQFFIVATGSSPGGLPPGCASADIGAVRAAGRSSAAGSTVSVTGAGADIWGTADAFHFLSCRLEGWVELTARVVSVQNVSQWTKAGLMIREAARRARARVDFATPSTVKGVAFQRRPVVNGQSAHASGPSFAPPVWLKIIRVGNLVTAFSRKNAADAWTRIDEWRFTDLQATVDVGFAISSHVAGTLATATFDNVTLNSQTFNVSGDIGLGSGPMGESTTDGATITIKAPGADIWGTADAFHFVAGPLAGDGTITARVRSIAKTHTWRRPASCFARVSAPTHVT